VANHSGMFLIHTREIPGKVFEGHQGNIEGITETDEPGNLVRGIHIEHSCHDLGLVAHKANGFTVNAPESDDGIGGPKLLNFQKF